MSYLDTFTETSTAPHQAVANNAISAIPETVQQRTSDVAVISSNENGKKSRKLGILDCFTVYYFTVTPLMKVSCFLVGSQDVPHGASGDQQVSLRKYGGKRN